MGEEDNTMEKLGNVDAVNVDANVDELSASELLRSVEATNSLPFVTMRKHKKSNKGHNRADVDGHSTNVSSGDDVLIGDDVPGATQATNEYVGNADVSGPTYHDFLLGVFGISLKSVSDINLFVNDLEAGKYTVWPTLDFQTQSQVQEAVVGLGKALVLDMQANAPSVVEAAKDDNRVPKETQPTMWGH
ncbi:hypothetical protein CTI12_AA107680 [Artemisia annua]|uniref:Uncharacterized protein n=1 Tax=Artemisia annua TaxID=35608 RepID=A0A2U1PUI7_ARTAN|nr:hypothetical protein CTI12_AA107680 [Artemisia annua]